MTAAVHDGFLALFPAPPAFFLVARRKSRGPGIKSHVINILLCMSIEANLKNGCALHRRLCFSAKSVPQTVCEDYLQEQCLPSISA